MEYNAVAGAQPRQHFESVVMRLAGSNGATTHGVSVDDVDQYVLRVESGTGQMSGTEVSLAREAAILLQQASARFRDARETRDYVRAAKLRAEGETRLADLARVSAEAWPWGRWAEAAREFEVIVPANGGAPVFEGLRMRVPGGMMVGSQHARFVEFGRVVSIEGGVGIGVRALGGGSWTVVTPARIERLGVAPEDLLAGFPEDEAALRPVIEAHILGALGRGEGWEGLGLREGADAWLVRWWPTIEKSLLEGIRSGGIADEVFPAAQEDRLVLRQAAELGEAVLLPPTRTGCWPSARPAGTWCTWTAKGPRM